MIESPSQHLWVTFEDGYGRRRPSKKEHSIVGWRSAKSERLRLDADTRYIEVLRRELANIIISENLNKMVALYRKCWTFEQEILKADAAKVQAEFEVIIKRYPLYEHFDRLANSERSSTTAVG